MQKRILLFVILINSNLISGSYDNNKNWWINTELLYWSLKKNNTHIPFVTSASLSDPLPGALGQPGTKVQLSSCSVNSINNNLGFRFLAGTSINKYKNIELELSYFLLPQKTSKCSLQTNGQPGSTNLAVPVYDTTGVWGLNGNPGETIAVLPGPLFDEPGFYGNFNLCKAAKFQGTELNANFKFCRWDRSWLMGSIGFGWMQFIESITFDGQTHTNSNSSIPSDFFNFTDQFKTQNNFYGALFGIHTQHCYLGLKFQAIITCGIGVMQNRSLIKGSSQTETGNLFFLTSNTAGQTLSGGIFTQPSNIGTFKQNKFSGMFETIIRGSYSLRDNIEISLGYNFILLGNIIHAEDQIDRKINSTRTSLADASRATVGIGTGPIPFGKPGAAPLPIGDKNPVSFYKPKNLWVQGLIAGLSIYF